MSNIRFAAFFLMDLYLWYIATPRNGYDNGESIVFSSFALLLMVGLFVVSLQDFTAKDDEEESEEGE